jgi:hypothetical protein
VPASLTESAGTIVFGMEDGTVSIFGLIFGFAATTNDSVAILASFNRLPIQERRLRRSDPSCT